MRATATLVPREPIPGVVAGWTLIIDPEHQDNRFERIEFDDVQALRDHKKKFDDAEAKAEAETEGYWGVSALMFTRFRYPDGSQKEEEGLFSLMSGTQANIGDRFLRIFCAKCQQGAWFPEGVSETYTCGDCVGGGTGSLEFNNADGSQEIEY